MASSVAEKKSHVYTDDELREKLLQLPPKMQQTFMFAMQAILTKESKMFLQFLAESRAEIGDVQEDISQEQDVLRATSNKLETERNGVCVTQTPLLDGFLSKRDKIRQATTITIEKEKEQAAIAEYLRTVGREKTLPLVGQDRSYNYARPISSNKDRETQDSARRSGTSHRVRIESPYQAEYYDNERPKTGGRDSVVPFKNKFDAYLAEEHQEILHSLEKQEELAEQERKRQFALVAAKKAARRAKKENCEMQVEELMAQNEDIKSHQQRDKERQDNIVQEKLTKKKLERAKSIMKMQSVDQSDFLDATVTEQPKPSKKKKKKKELEAMNEDEDIFSFPAPVLDREPTAVQQEEVAKVKKVRSKERSQTSKSKGKQAVESNPIVENDDDAAVLPVQVIEKKKKTKKSVVAEEVPVEIN